MLLRNLAFISSFVICVLKAESPYAVPKVTFEAKKGVGFRAYIPDIPNTSLFALHANVNDDIAPQSQGEISKQTRIPENGYWILEFDRPLKPGDVVNYWIFVSADGLGYRKDGEHWKVNELLEEYSRLQSECNPSITVINGRKSTCVGDVIINDDFNNIQRNLWTIEHRIPTYVGPSYEFNSYEDRTETRFIKDSILYLKPIVSTTIRGVLDLKQGCTAKKTFECFYESKSVFYLPPIMSARITSKISFQYGKVEVRAKLPAGDWIFPIIQLQPINGDEENPPRVWIAYSRGNDFLKGISSAMDVRSKNGDDIGSRLLFGGPVLYSSEPERSAKLTSKQEPTPFYTEFRTYSLQWTKDDMTFYVDGQNYGTVSLKQNFALPNLGIGNNWNTENGPFNQEYKLSLGVAVGGQYDFPDGYNSKSGMKPWSTGVRTYLKDFFDAQNQWLSTWDGDKTALQIDYVKVTAI